MRLELRMDGQRELSKHTNLEHSYGPVKTNQGIAVYRNVTILHMMAGEMYMKAL